MLDILDISEEFNSSQRKDGWVFHYREIFINYVAV